MPASVHWKWLSAAWAFPLAHTTAYSRWRAPSPIWADWKAFWPSTLLKPCSIAAWTGITGVERYDPDLRDDAELTSQIRCNGVVPSGQCVAVSKAERGDQMRFRFETGPILLSVQIGGHNQSGSGAGGANEVEHRFIAVQWLGSPVLGDL